MKIRYANNKIRKYCLNNKLALQKFGTKVAKRLKNIVAVLHATTNMNDVRSTIPKTHWLQGNRRQQISIPLADGKSLILETLNEESREWKLTDRIVIKTIEDYHK